MPPHTPPVGPALRCCVVEFRRNTRRCERRMLLAPPIVPALRCDGVGLRRDPRTPMLASLRRGEFLCAVQCLVDGFLYLNFQTSTSALNSLLLPLAAWGYGSCLCYLMVVMKFWIMVLPVGVMTDSGWNWTPKVGWVLCSTAMTSPWGEVAVIFSSSGRVSGSAAREW